MAYLSIVALIPLAAVVLKSFENGVDALLERGQQPAGRGRAAS